MESDFSSLAYETNIKRISYTDPDEYLTWLMKLLEGRKKLANDIVDCNYDLSVVSEHLDYYNRYICECLHIDPKTL